MLRRALNPNPGTLNLNFNATAAQRGNEAAAAEYQERLAAVWRKYDCNPFRSILGALAQAPLFIGFFSALRAMALAKARPP